MLRHIQTLAASLGETHGTNPSPSPHAQFLRQQQERTVTDEEKARLRAFLLSRMNEPNDIVRTVSSNPTHPPTHPTTHLPSTQVAKNTAHVLAKVVRADWPKTWSDFFPQLLSLLPPTQEDSSSSSLQTLRVIHTVHRVTKELAGKG